MSTLDDIKALLTRQTAAIENVAADIKRLADSIPGTDSIGQADALALKQQLEGMTTRLEEVAALTPEPPAGDGGTTAGETSGAASGGGGSDPADEEADATDASRTSRRRRS